MSDTDQRLGIYEFDAFRLDVVERSLWRRQKRIPLGGRAFDVLATLVRQGGRLVTKEELLQQAWKGRVVEEGNIHVQISTLRRLLGEKAISTISGHGYRFELPLERGVGATGPTESNLPAALTPLVSRDKELRELSQLLGQHRLVTVKGMGGLGKSSVATEIGRRLQQENASLRCWYVPLGAMEKGDALQSTVLHAVDRRPRAGKPIDESLLMTLREKPTLLLLDGCEVVADAAARTIRKMLEQCPELKIICTSRHSLGLVGEAVFDLPPLDLSGARKLFLERAASASRSIDPATVDKELLDRILSRLDGIPLAIELAASRLRAVGLKDLESQLSDRLGTLVGTDRSMPSRQSTLRATLEWSYRLLSGSERDFLNRIAIFQAPFTADAAAYVGLGAGKTAGDAIGLLTALVDKSLLTLDVSNQLSRYRILDSVREYGLCELEKVAQTSGMRERCSTYYLKYLSEAVEYQFRPEWMNDYLPCLRTSWPDLLASLKYTLEVEVSKADIGANLASKLIYFWVDEGRIYEAEKWLEIASGLSSLSKETKLALLHATGCAYAERGLATKASEKLKMAVAGYKKLGTCPQELAISANELGINFFGLVRYKEARANYELAIRINTELGNVAREGQALQNLAVLELVGEKIDLAEQLLTKAIQLHKRAQNVRSESMSSIWLAECKFLKGEFAESLLLLERARALRAPITADVPAASIAFRIARSAAMLGRYSTAGRSSLEALAIIEPIGNLSALLASLDAIVVVAHAMKLEAKSRSLLSAVDAWREIAKVSRSPIWDRYFRDLSKPHGPSAEGLSSGAKPRTVAWDSEALRIAKEVATFAASSGTGA